MDDTSEDILPLAYVLIADGLINFNDFCDNGSDNLSIDLLSRETVAIEKSSAVDPPEIINQELSKIVEILGLIKPRLTNGYAIPKISPRGEITPEFFTTFGLAEEASKNLFRGKRCIVCDLDIPYRRDKHAKQHISQICSFDIPQVAKDVLAPLFVKYPERSHLENNCLLRNGKFFPLSLVFLPGETSDPEGWNPFFFISNTGGLSCNKCKAPKFKVLENGNLDLAGLSWSKQTRQISSRFWHLLGCHPDVFARNFYHVLPISEKIPPRFNLLPSEKYKNIMFKKLLKQDFTTQTESTQAFTISDEDEPKIAGLFNSYRNDVRNLERRHYGNDSLFEVHEIVSDLNVHTPVDMGVEYINTEIVSLGKRKVHSESDVAETPPKKQSIPTVALPVIHVPSDDDTEDDNDETPAAENMVVDWGVSEERASSVVATGRLVRKYLHEDVSLLFSGFTFGNQRWEKLELDLSSLTPMKPTKVNDVSLVKYMPIKMTRENFKSALVTHTLVHQVSITGPFRAIGAISFFRNSDGTDFTAVMQLERMEETLYNLKTVFTSMRTHGKFPWEDDVEKRSLETLKTELVELILPQLLSAVKYTCAVNKKGIFTYENIRLTKNGLSIPLRGVENGVGTIEIVKIALLCALCNTDTPYQTGAYVPENDRLRRIFTALSTLRKFCKVPDTTADAEVHKQLALMGLQFVSQLPVELAKGLGVSGNRLHRGLPIELVDRSNQEVDHRPWFYIFGDKPNIHEGKVAMEDADIMEKSFDRAFAANNSKLAMEPHEFSAVTSNLEVGVVEDIPVISFLELEKMDWTNPQMFPTAVTTSEDTSEQNIDLVTPPSEAQQNNDPMIDLQAHVDKIDGTAQELSDDLLEILGHENNLPQIDSIPENYDPTEELLENFPTSYDPAKDLMEELGVWDLEAAPPLEQDSLPSTSTHISQQEPFSSVTVLKSPIIQQIRVEGDYERRKARGGIKPGGKRAGSGSKVHRKEPVLLLSPFLKPTGGESYGTYDQTRRYASHVTLVGHDVPGAEQRTYEKWVIFPQGVQRNSQSIKEKTVRQRQIANEIHGRAAHETAMLDGSKFKFTDEFSPGELLVQGQVSIMETRQDGAIPFLISFKDTPTANTVVVYPGDKNVNIPNSFYSNSHTELSNYSPTLMVRNDIFLQDKTARLPSYIPQIFAKLMNINYTKHIPHIYISMFPKDIKGYKLRVFTLTSDMGMPIMEKGASGKIFHLVKAMVRALTVLHSHGFYIGFIHPKNIWLKRMYVKETQAIQSHFLFDVHSQFLENTCMKNNFIFTKKSLQLPPEWGERSIGMLDFTPQSDIFSMCQVISFSTPENEMTPQLKDLLIRGLHVDPEQRPPLSEFSEILNILPETPSTPPDILKRGLAPVKIDHLKSNFAIAHTMVRFRVG